MRGARIALWAGPILVIVGLVGSVRAAELTDKDRLWRNFNYETAVVDQGQLRLEVRGLFVHDATDVNALQVIARGFPAGDKDRNERRDDVRSQSAGVFDLVGSYGLVNNLEVGFDIVGITQSLRFPRSTAQDPEGTYPENSVDLGDMTLYGKYKYAIDDNLAFGAGVEVRVPTGQEKKRLGMGDPGTMPFLSMRYTSGRVGFGGNVGYQINEGNLDDVVHWSAHALVRPRDSYAMRVELTGRHFEYAGLNLDDIFLMPGIDYNYSDMITIRPTGLAGIANESLDWGLGVGVSFLF